MNHSDTEQRWPRYLKAARDLGVRSHMGLRLFAETETVGGLNLYSTQGSSIDYEVIYVAQLFATHASLALGKTRREADLLRAITSQRAVGQAVGLLMGPL